MEPAEYNFNIYKGTTWSRQCTLYDDDDAVVELASYQARMTIRKNVNSTAILSLNQNSGITLADASPNLTITITSTQTGEMDFIHAYYDLEIESAGGTIDQLLYGRITLVKEITS